MSFIYAIDSLMRERRRARERERQAQLGQILRKRHLAQRRRMGRVRRAAPGSLRALGLDEHATPDDVLVAYRRLAFDLHPDRGGDPDDFKRLHHHFEQAMLYSEARGGGKPTKPRCNDAGGNAANPVAIAQFTELLADRQGHAMPMNFPERPKPQQETAALSD